VAVHEAGHAVARFAAAGELGIEPDEAIDCIEVGVDPHPHETLDGKATVSSSAITFGPKYSGPMTNYLKDNPVQQGPDPLDGAILRAEVMACKAGGIDVAKWASVKAFICMAGPVAEAKFSGKTLDEILKSYECEGDLRAAIRDGELAGLTRSEACEMTDRGCDRAVEFFDDSKAWCAVLTLADRFPRVGRMQGKRCAAIIRAAYALDGRRCGGADANAL
jgi:hypothetical protein